MTLTTEPSTCVFGGGAVGQYLAGMLCESQLPNVSVVCRGSTFRDLKNAGGISVKDVPREKTFNANRLQVLDSENLDDDLEKPDIILCCAKAHHLSDALPALRKMMGPNTLLVTIQNGLPFHLGHLTSHHALAGKPLHTVDPGGSLFSSFSSNEVVAGVVYVSAERTGPAEVTCCSVPTVTRFLFGQLQNKKDSRTKALQGVVDALTSVGVQASIEPDILSCIWRKLLASATVNPANALAHGYIDTLLKAPRSAAMLEALASEVMQVGKAVGAKFEFTAAAWRAECAAKWPRSKVSMLQDVEAGRELEVAALVLVVSDLAAMLEIQTPRLDTVAALIHLRNENLMRREYGSAEKS